MRIVCVYGCVHMQGCVHVRVWGCEYMNVKKCDKLTTKKMSDVSLSLNRNFERTNVYFNQHASIL